MNLKKNLKNSCKKIKGKIIEFLSDEYGGNLVEYALLIGFALFIFFIIVGVITSLLNWTLGLSDDFFNVIGGG
jgi:Flp pilus assembly pilin Flp